VVRLRGEVGRGGRAWPSTGALVRGEGEQGWAGVGRARKRELGRGEERGPCFLSLFLFVV